MINTIIFDFGDVFINLDKSGALQNALDLFRIKEFDDDLIALNEAYEKGLISTNAFIDSYSERFPFVPKEELYRAWNCIILDFPEYRMDFLRKLRSDTDYRLMLLSNTNHLHIDYVKETVSFYEEFKAQFDRFYLSHLINLRKPDREVYEMILYQNKLEPESCLFVDDTSENTHTAARLGMKTWTLDPEVEDVIELFQKYEL